MARILGQPAKKSEVVGAPGAWNAFAVLTFNVAGFYQDLPLDGSALGDILKKAGWGQGIHAGDNAPYVAELLRKDALVFLQEDWSYYDTLAGDPCLKGTQPHKSLPSFTPAELKIDGLNDWEDFKGNPGLFDQAVAAVLASPNKMGHGLATYSRFVMDSLDLSLNQSTQGRYDIKPGFEGWGTLCTGYDCATNKGFTYDLVQVKNTSGNPVGTLCVYNHHTNSGNTQEDRNTRQQEYDKMLKHIESFCPGKAVLIVGDTNLEPWNNDGGTGNIDQTTLDNIKKAGFQDTTPEGSADIDRVFFRDSKSLQFTVLGYEEMQVTNPKTGEPLSDHNPTRIEFKVTALPLSK